MGWFERLKGKLATNSKPQFRAEGPPDVKFLGDVLVYQFLGDRFGLKEEQFTQCVSDLPEELRDLTKLWILLYLSWVFKVYAASKYGQGFARELLTQAKERFNKAESVDKDFQGLNTNFEFWLTRLDDSTSQIGTEIHGVEVPFEVIAAVTFLALDASSPFYKSTGPKDIVFDVGIALAAAKDDAMELIQNSIDIGGPVK